MKKVWIYIITLLLLFLVNFLFIAAIVKLGAVILGYKFTWKVALFIFLCSMLASSIFGNKHS